MGSSTTTKAYEFKATLRAPANADLSALQYHAVKLNSSGKIVSHGTADDLPLGVLQNAPSAADDIGIISIDGQCLVELAGDVDAGAAIKHDANDEFVAATSGDQAWGFALEAGGDGDVRPAVHKPHTLS